MEHGTDLLYQMMAIIFFVLAVTLWIAVFQSIHKLEMETKRNIYEQHVLHIDSPYE